MLFEIICTGFGLMGAVSAVVSQVNAKSKRNEVKLKPINPVVQELIKSLEGDDGWAHYAKHKLVIDHNNNFCDCYYNRNSKIRFTLYNNSSLLPGAIYGGILEPFLQEFTSAELSLIKKAIETMLVKSIIDARMKAADYQLDSSLEKQFVDLEKKDSEKPKTVVKEQPIIKKAKSKRIVKK